MKRKFIPILILCVVSVFATSCKKDNSGEEVYLGSCYITSLGLMEFDYTSDHKLRYVLAYDFKGYPMDTVIVYHYNTGGRIFLVEYNPGDPETEFDSILYSESGKVSSCIHYLNGIQNGTAAYHYNEQGQLDQVDLSGYFLSKYSHKSSLVSATILYQYNSDGNVISETVTSGSVIESNTYEYDSKRNPYKEWNLPEGFGTFNMPKLISKNNYIKEVNSYGSQTTTTIVSYSYNSNGYPVTMTFTEGEQYEVLYLCVE